MEFEYLILLIFKVQKYYYALTTLIITNYTWSIDIDNVPRTDPDQNFHYVVDCGRQVMKEHCYWPVVSDLNNVLSHKPVAVRFMSDDSLLEMWFQFLSMFQGNFFIYIFYR